ncbi:MAG: hypothetical protein AB1641_23605 [Thermodesulfobacteriota bacterium]
MTTGMIHPDYFVIRQVFPRHPEPRVEAWLDEELDRSGLLAPIAAGQKVLITAGSRGTDSLPAILAGLVRRVRAQGGRPIIFPAMGSHGGATGPGQVRVLNGLGITENTVGAPIHEGWQSVKIATATEETPVYVDRAATEADHIILVNRIKEHTDFIGLIESGLVKISVIGLGRRPGAESMHRLAVSLGYYRSLQTLSRVIFERVNILGGIAQLEDHFNRLRRIEAVPAERIFDREPALLAESRNFKPKLPFAEIDLLMIDQIGKEISGTGADTKVIGRIMNRFEEETVQPFIKRIVVRDLSPGSYGNAIGIGLADYTTFRLPLKTDHEKTAVNCLAGGRPELGRMPLALASDRQALESALSNIGPWRAETVRLVWIQNTKKLERLVVSRSLKEEAERRDDLRVESGPFSLSFDSTGNLETRPGLWPGGAGYVRSEERPQNP